MLETRNNEPEISFTDTFIKALKAGSILDAMEILRSLRNEGAGNFVLYNKLISLIIDNDITYDEIGTTTHEMGGFYLAITENRARCYLSRARHCNSCVLKTFLHAMEKARKSINLSYKEIGTSRREIKKLEAYANKLYEIAEIQFQLNNTPIKRDQHCVVVKRKLNVSSSTLQEVYNI